MNDNVFMHAVHEIEIGNNRVISHVVVLISERMDVFDFEKYKNHVHFWKNKNWYNGWFGAKAIVLLGVTIANNIFVGAGSNSGSKGFNGKYGLSADNPVRLIRKLSE